MSHLIRRPAETKAALFSSFFGLILFKNYTLKFGVAAIRGALLAHMTIEPDVSSL